MEDILKYEKREQLFKFLIDNFGFVKIKEIYDSISFGNFLITLSSKDLLLSYVNDRSFLTIIIASKLDPDNGLDLSFVRDYIYNPENINTEESEMNNTKRIEELNNFLRRDLTKIYELFNSYNYPNTRKQINILLKQKFNERFL